MAIWIVGGTKDSAAIIKAISAVTSDFVVTVTTPEARQLYDSASVVIVGAMNRESMEKFCLCYEIHAIVDVSHPFAVEVSQNAIATAKILNIPYLRYERTAIDSDTSPLNIQLPNFETLLEGDYLVNQRVLLAVGCKVLPLFKSWQDRAILFARILPKLNSLQTAIDSGFTSDRIIAIRPPVSKALEIALWQQWHISLVVTKASGKSGGEDIKQKVAHELGIPLITIARPKVTYPRQTFDLQEVIKFCAQHKTIAFP